MRARSRAATRSPPCADQIARNTSAATGTRTAIRPHGASSRSTSLATTPSDANSTWTVTSAMAAVRRDESLLFNVVAAGALDRVLVHELAEVLAVDVGLARGVRDVVLVLLEQRHEVV